MTAPAVEGTAARTSCRKAPVPAAQALSWEQYAGRSCVACGKPLTTGAIWCGVARGRQGAHVLDTEVWACP
ncbi:hypothetical protein ACWGI8_24245 [Streptomyces sp. NPDC054841]